MIESYIFTRITWTNQRSLSHAAGRPAREHPFRLVSHLPGRRSLSQVIVVVVASKRDQARGRAVPVSVLEMGVTTPGKGCVDQRRGFRV